MNCEAKLSCTREPCTSREYPADHASSGTRTATPTSQGLEEVSPSPQRLAMLEQFLPLPLEIKSTPTYLPCARPFMWWARWWYLALGVPSLLVRIPVRHATAVTQTSPYLDVACGHPNMHEIITVPTPIYHSGRAVSARESGLWTDWLEVPAATPSAGDQAVTTVTHGVASIWQPHSGDANLPHVTRGELVLSTSFKCWLNSALRAGGMF